MTPIERAARAIHNFRQSRGFGGLATWESEPHEIHTLHLDTARAVLEALREPSDFMLDAGGNYVETRLDTRENWQAMIDAALGECE